MSYIYSTFFLLVNLTVICALLYLVIFFDDMDNFPRITYIELPVLVPTVILSFYLFISEYLFVQFTTWITKRENHKTTSKFEESFISKIYYFYFCNRILPCIIISFLAKRTLKCY